MSFCRYGFGTKFLLQMVPSFDLFVYLITVLFHKKAGYLKDKRTSYFEILPTLPSQCKYM